MQVDTTDAATARARRALAFALRWIGTVSGSAMVAVLLICGVLAVLAARAGILVRSGRLDVR